MDRTKNHAVLYVKQPRYSFEALNRSVGRLVPSRCSVSQSVRQPGAQVLGWSTGWLVSQFMSNYNFSINRDLEIFKRKL